MNILYVSSKKNWGGVNSWMVKTAKGLLSRGHKVWIAGSARSKFAEQVAHEPFFIPVKFGPEYNPLAIFKIWRLLKKHRIDLIVTNLEKEIAVAGIAAKLAGIPNIRRVGRHDDFNDKKPKIRFRHEHFVTASIAPCDAIYTEARSHSPWLQAHPFTTIYNGRNPVTVPDETVKSLRKQWGVEGFATVLGVTCRLDEEKRIDFLLEGLAPLLKTRPEAALVIAGTGKLEQALKKQAENLGIAGQTFFIGFVSNPVEVAAAYDAGFLVSDNEGFPNTVVEYMAAGTPALATDVGGVNELIRDGENGFLISPGDTAQLREKAAILLDNAALRQEMGYHAAQTLRNGFTEDQMIDHVESFFKTLLEKPA